MQSYSKVTKGRCRLNWGNMLGPSGNLLLSWIREGFCFDSTLGQNQGILFSGLALKTNKNKTFCKSQPACLPGRFKVTVAEMFRGDGYAEPASYARGCGGRTEPGYVPEPGRPSGQRSALRLQSPPAGQALRQLSPRSSDLGEDE